MGNRDLPDMYALIALSSRILGIHFRQSTCHCTLLLDYNKQRFHSKGLTRLFQKVFNVPLHNTCTMVHQGTGYPGKRPHGGLKVLG